MSLKQHKTGTKQFVDKFERKGLDCKECGKFVDNLSSDTKAVTCSHCVVKMIGPPKYKDKSVVKRPRGWQFKKEYVAPDGTKYIRGRAVNADSKDNSGSSVRAKRKNK